MTDVTASKRVLGWMMFDWASQPYSTLLLTFTFGPYFAEMVTDSLTAGGMDESMANATAQSYWAYGLSISGLLIALFAPILGAIADASGHRIRWILFFSILYVTGAYGLWWSSPVDFNITRTLMFFGIGLIGVEFAAIFSNSLLPTLGPRSEIGRISGTGWALGYIGGVLALIIAILFLTENKSGLTLLGNAPAFGLDASLREGTRAVGPLTAIWYVVFMVPFFLWVKEQNIRKTSMKVVDGLRDLAKTLRNLPNDKSQLAYLGSSMFYRDALNGFYIFGGIYAYGVLGWSVVDVGVFGIMAVITGAIFSWIGGQADRRFGPKRVITTCITILLAVCFLVISISRESIMGIPVAEGSKLPDYLFYFCGGVIGGAGGALQASSRTMMVHQANPDRMTEAFGLYALAGKATSFLAPFSIAIVSTATGSQRLGITPLIVLFLIGLILLFWVKTDKERAVIWSESS